jgi:hypothetical protein
MPAPPRRDLPLEHRLAVTENARREARYRCAQRRVDKIANGTPALTIEQRAELARRLTAGEGP